MKTSLLATSAVVLGLVGATISLPARSDSGDTILNKIFAANDKNQDGLMTKSEFLAGMGKAYDEKLAKFKAEKNTEMMKGDAMTKQGLKSLLNDVWSGA